MTSVMTGLEIIDNVLGQDGSGYPAAVTQRHLTMTMAGAGTNVSTGETDALSNIILQSVAGLSQGVIAGNYKFRCILPGAASASGGVKMAFQYASCSITILEATSKIFTAAGVAVQHVTATTSQSSLVASTTAAILTEIEGTMTVGSVVAPSGTITLQFAQNTSSTATSSIYIGASMNFVKY